MCVVLVSGSGRRIFLVSLSSAQGCLQCQRIPRRRRNTVQISRDAVITHWGSFGSRDLPLYATSTKLQIRQRADGYRAELPYRVEKAKRVEGCDGVDKRATPKPLTFAMTCQHYYVEDLPDRIMQLKGLALKKTPIYADSAVSRHDRHDEGEKGEKRLRRRAKNKSRGNDIDIYTDALATCLSVSALPNVDTGGHA